LKKQGQRWFLGGTGVVIALASGALILSAQLPLDPIHSAGNNVTPAYEGWYELPDGTFNILVGYYNRNTKESIDIPVGPNNHLDPGGPDLGQPTHFLPGRQWGVFVINVPKDFGAQKRITWTIVANGKPASVPFHLDPVYNVAPFKDATNNTPPFLGFSEGGPFQQGPPIKISHEFTATVGEPLTLDIWGGDDNVIPPGAQFGRGRGPSSPFTVTWMKFRGPGDVTFAKAKPAVQKGDFKVPAPAVFAGTANTTATFSAPGDYILEVVANDISGDGGRGFQCCWTTLQAKVTVKAGTSAQK
jgi:hypothetical protein